MSADASIAHLLSTRSTLARIGAYEITDDPDKVDLDVVHQFLSRECPGRDGLTVDQVRTSMRTCLPLSVQWGGSAPGTVGFLRVVTDTLTHAWLDDLFVLREHRRRGLAHALVEAALEHPAVHRAARQWLHTAGPQPTYAGHGFTPFGVGAVLLVRPGS